MGADDPIVIAADGSCLGNPGPGGWSCATSATSWMAGGHKQTTNNLMELRAVFEALAATPVDHPLVVETDSQYVVMIFTEWLDGWKQNGWRTASRKPVSNRAAILEVDRLLQGRTVAWKHVKGHAGHVLNEIVDLHAHDAATAVKTNQRVDLGPGINLAPSSSGSGDLA